MSREPSKDDLEEIRQLKALRIKIGKTQGWIAEHVEVSAQQWGKYERGEDRIPAGRARRACRALMTAYAPDLPKNQFGEHEQLSYSAESQEDELSAAFRVAREALDRLEEIVRRSSST